MTGHLFILFIASMEMWKYCKRKAMSNIPLFLISLFI